MKIKTEKFESNRVPKLGILSLGVIFLLGSLWVTIAYGVEDPRVKILMQEALQLYSERRYVKALDLFKQVKRIDPENNLANEYIKSTEKKINDWETQGVVDPSQSDVNWDSLMDSKSAPATEEISNAKDIIAARRSLVDRMRNRAVDVGNIVKIEDRKGELEVVLFHDQLFLPGLQTLRDDALPVLENVALLIRQAGDKPVKIYSVSRNNSNDPFLLYPDFPIPAPDPTGRSARVPEGGSSFLFQDIEATRSFILFTHLAQRSMGKVASRP